jgi:hypothetical protein
MKGLFRPKNPKKYHGNVHNIVYRSSWEFVMMTRLDTSPDVIGWQSEELAIPYISPLDGRVHRYYPDFVVKRKSAKTGKIEVIVIEIKPNKECSAPKQKGAGKPTRKFLREVATWGRNDAKWAAARRYCEANGYQFLIMDEYSLGLKKKHK